MDRETKVSVIEFKAANVFNGKNLVLVVSRLDVLGKKVHWKHFSVNSDRGQQFISKYFVLSNQRATFTLHSWVLNLTEMSNTASQAVRGWLYLRGKSCTTWNNLQIRTTTPID